MWSWEKPFLLLGWLPVVGQPKKHWLSFLKKMSHSSIAKVILDNFLELGNMNHRQVLTSEHGFLSVPPTSVRVSFPLYLLTLQVINTFFYNSADSSHVKNSSSEKQTLSGSEFPHVPRG